MPRLFGFSDEADGQLQRTDTQREALRVLKNYITGVCNHAEAAFDLPDKLPGKMETLATAVQRITKETAPGAQVPPEAVDEVRHQVLEITLTATANGNGARAVQELLRSP